MLDYSYTRSDLYLSGSSCWEWFKDEAISSPYYSLEIFFFQMTKSLHVKVVFWLKVCFRKIYCWKLKYKNWKYYKKIVFKYINNTVRFAFNEKFDSYGSNTLSTKKSQQRQLSAKQKTKKKGRKRELGRNLKVTIHECSLSCKVEIWIKKKKILVWRKRCI